MTAKTIQLTQGKQALVDSDDYERLSARKWCVTPYGYAVRNGWERKRGTNILMHREVIKVPSYLHVDHINGDKLDNRKLNLRVATPQQNQYNKPVRKDSTTGIKGVRRIVNVHYVSWAARIRYKGVYTHIGSYPKRREAASAYNQFAVKLFGEYAKLNNLEEIHD